MHGDESAANLSVSDSFAARESALITSVPELPTIWSRPAFMRLRIQLPSIIVVSAILPGLVLQLPDLWSFGSWTSASNTVLLTVGCSVVALMLFRRLEKFPGISSFAQIAPSVTAAYGLVLTAVVLLRVSYSRSLLLLSAVSCLSFLAFLWVHYRRNSRANLYLLPGSDFPESGRLQLHRLQSPTSVIDPYSIVAADFGKQLEPAWQRFILSAALAGIPVYDVKNLEETVTGKVQISHLSENTFGSVLPGLPYLRIKRVADLLLAGFALPLVGAAMIVVALAIRLDSRGPVLFRQRRVGFRGQPFLMLKFRTMRIADPESGVCRINAAKTRDGDDRITRVGRFLRRHRIDELPQVFNILKGEMSWIGPRPEAEALAHHYESNIPFYGYRHTVRPGITGWAQVNQGHVVEVDEIRNKLAFDFFYIKNFSAWLDALVAARTIRIVLFGNGAR